MNLTLFDDEVFRFLCRFTVRENFYRRTLKEGVHFEGVENQKLVGCLIVRDVPILNRHIKQGISFHAIRGMDLAKRLCDDAHMDGAYIIEKGMLSNKVFMQNFVSDVMRYRAITSIEQLQQKCLPEDFLSSGTAVALETPIIGGRTQVAIAAGLCGGRGYLIKQSAYGGLPVGKVCMFTRNGLEREFFLLRNEGAAIKDNEYFEPRRRIVGVLRTYGPIKRERQEYIVLASDLDIDPQKYLPSSSLFSSMLEIIPMIKTNVTQSLFR